MSWVIHGVVRLLLEHGCQDISIGEGAIIAIFDELDAYTKRGFRGTGIEKIAKKYGIGLVDFDADAFNELDLRGIKVQVSKAALDADFLVKYPGAEDSFSDCKVNRNRAGDLS